MKESLYGWYPAAKDLRAANQRGLDTAGSHKQWLAKCCRDGRWAPTPDRPTETRLTTAKSALADTRTPLSTPVDFAPVPPELKTAPKSFRRFSARSGVPAQVCGAGLTRAWSAGSPATPLSPGVGAMTCTGVGLGESRPGSQPQAPRQPRVRSAASYRQKTAVPQRRVKSASVNRQNSADDNDRYPFCARATSPASGNIISPELLRDKPATYGYDSVASPVVDSRKPQAFDYSLEEPEAFERGESGNGAHVHITVSVTSRPQAPTPPIESPTQVASPASSEPRDEDGVVDFQSQLKKYGWRMQVPGDPLNLKRQCIPKRPSFTERLPTPAVPPRPARGHMQNFNTYFLNTIPRRRQAYSIHDEWISEVLHAKRIELQKRDGKDYIYRGSNFSFLY